MANRDQAFAAVAQALHEIVLRYQAPATPPRPDNRSALEDRSADVKPRILDAAIPNHVVKDRASELLVLIRLLDSAGLKGVLQADDEADARPEDVRSKPFDVVFPLSPIGRPQPLKVSVEVTAPDFQPPSQRKNLFVPVSTDSEVCAFLLTPVRTGPLTVGIELIWEDADRGYRRLRTNCVAESESAAVVPVMNVVQLPLAVSKAEAVAEPRVLAAGASSGSYSMPARAVSPPIAAVAQSFPPPAPSAQPPAPAVASARGGSFWSSPGLKVAALALCVISLGSFFLFQKNGTSSGPVAASPPVMTPAATPQVEVSNADIEAAALEFRKAVAAHPPPQSAPPEITAAIEKGRNNLAAARTAMANGRKLQAGKHLELVRQATELLKAK